MVAATEEASGPNMSVTSVEDIDFDGMGELELAVDGFGDQHLDDYDGILDDLGAGTRNQKIAVLTLATGLGAYVLSGMGKKGRSHKKRMESSLMWAALYAGAALLFFPRQGGA
jgi:hypothetical protein